jgi:GxxExxY protein
MNHGEDLTGRIIGLAMYVHRSLGPGLYESTYQRCLCHALSRNEIPYEEQVSLPIRFDGAEIESGYRADIIVAKEVVLELKAVEQLAPLHSARLLTYLRFSGCRIGLLINFNTLSLTDGIRRRVH